MIWIYLSLYYLLFVVDNVILIHRGAESETDKISWGKL